MSKIHFEIKNKERLKLFKEVNCDPIRIDMHKFQINIINKTPEQSDTWEIEGEKK